MTRQEKGGKGGKGGVCELFQPELNHTTVSLMLPGNGGKGGKGGVRKLKNK